MIYLKSDSFYTLVILHDIVTTVANFLIFPYYHLRSDPELPLITLNGYPLRGPRALSVYWENQILIGACIYDLLYIRFLEQYKEPKYFSSLNSVPCTAPETT